MASVSGRSALSRRDILRAAAFAVPLCWMAPGRAATKILIIVNPDVKVNVSPGDVAAIFTTQRRYLEGTQRAMPFNLPAKSEVRVEFDQRVLGMGADEVARYWIDRRVRGGANPPTQVPSPEVMAKIVSRISGGIGYVPSGTRLFDARVVLEI